MVMSRGFGRPIGVVRRKISEFCFEFNCASISFYFLPLILSPLSPPQRFYLIIPVLFQFSPTRRQKLKVRLRDWAGRTHNFRSFCFNPPPVLDRHNVGRTKPAESAVPGCSGEQVPIFFGEHDLPEEFLILQVVASDNHLSSFLLYL